MSHISRDCDIERITNVTQERKIYFLKTNLYNLEVSKNQDIRKQLYVKPISKTEIHGTGKNFRLIQVPS